MECTDCAAADADRRYVLGIPCTDCVAVRVHNDPATNLVGLALHNLERSRMIHNSRHLPALTEIIQSVPGFMIPDELLPVCSCKLIKSYITYEE